MTRRSELVRRAAWISILLATPWARGAEPAPNAPGGLTVEQLAAKVKPSVVVVSFSGRSGQQEGLGTGFIIDPSGLIATNLHVIGQARPIAVRTADGKALEVTHIHASDRSLDLAVLRVKEKGLPALPLGVAREVRDGQAVVAIGNPLGLSHSIVSGVASARRDVDGRSMIQVAMPVEPGNSGGPLLDLQGRVVGVITMKSRVTENLGFAVAIDQLKPLLAKPNTVPITRWLTIGSLDKSEWEPLFGAQWRQHAGRVEVDGLGSGFGGRSLCLSHRKSPGSDFELAVSVKLDDESGAAGLVFSSDGDQRHYGFYPTGGKLRLTRFEGPDVSAWTILRELPSAHYRAGEWNRLKVKKTAGKIALFVNDKPLFEMDEDRLPAGRVGLAKFRNTKAQFKSFQWDKQIPKSSPADEALAMLDAKFVEGLQQGKGPKELADDLASVAPTASSILRERAQSLRRQAAELARLADRVHERRVLAELAKVFADPDEKVDLGKASLLVARLDNEDLDVDAYARQLDQLAREAKELCPPGADAAARLEAVKKYLFAESGFHGSRGDYHSRSNSYINEVIDDREGLPLTLSILLMETARRLDVKVVGLPVPGHFLVRFIPPKGDPVVLDAFEGGLPVPAGEVEKRVREFVERAPTETELAPATNRSIVLRMLHNLLAGAQREQDPTSALRYLDGILLLNEQAVDERFLRAVLLAQSGRLPEAKADADWLLNHSPPELDLDRVARFRRALDQN